MKREFLIRAALAGVGCALTVGTARAEGSKKFNGAAGVNRVVRSTSNHTSASGHAHIEFTMPIDKDATGHYVYTLNVNPYNNKPSPYLGGEFVPGANARIDPDDDYTTPGTIPLTLGPTGLAQIDAGVQFEPGTVHNYPVGWAVAISVSDHYLPIRVLQKVGTITREVDPRVGSWSQDTSRLMGYGSYDDNFAFNISPTNGLSLKLDRLGTICWKQRLNNREPDTGMHPDAAHPVAPWQGDLRMVSPNQRGANVKKVVAMTRYRVTSPLDGSSLSCTWSGASMDNGAWSVNQPVTGYDAPGNDKADWKDRRLSRKPVFISGQPLSKTIVEFPGPDNLRLREDIVNPGRYNGETVNINLGTVALPAMTGNTEVELQP